MNARNKQTDIYNNWQMLSPDGMLLARCSQKRADWYLSRNIAEVISEKVIKLKFNPAGSGNIGVSFLLEEKKNVCVVCGTNHNLNRHHVVPYQYRRWMSEEDKGHSSYDVLPICLDHHDEYEEEAQQYSKELALKYNAPFLQNSLTSENIKTKKMFGLLKVIAEQLPVPEERLIEIKRQVDSFFLLNITSDVAIRILNKGLPTFTPIYSKSHGQVLIEKVLESNKLQEFIVSWRQHFISTMKPQFLSENWNVFHVHR